MSSTDGVHVASKMQVDVFHGHHLRISPARRSTLQAEAGAKRRFSNAYHRVLADPVQPVAEPHRRRCLAFACWCRSDRGDKDQFAAGPVRNVVQKFVIDLGLVGPV